MSDYTGPVNCSDCGQQFPNEAAYYAHLVPTFIASTRRSPEMCPNVGRLLATPWGQRQMAMGDRVADNLADFTRAWQAAE